MSHRWRNYSLTLMAVLVGWLVHPFFAKNLEVLMERQGWDHFLTNAFERLAQSSNPVSSYLSALFSGSGFWSGAFFVLVIWGAFELSYWWWRRRRRIINPVILPQSEHAIESSAIVHFDPSAATIEDSFNVQSVTDHGTGDFEIHFDVPLSARTLAIHPIGGAKPPDKIALGTVGGKVSSARVKYLIEPEVVRLRFES